MKAGTDPGRGPGQCPNLMRWPWLCSGALSYVLLHSQRSILEKHLAQVARRCADSAPRHQRRTPTLSRGCPSLWLSTGRTLPEFFCSQKYKDVDFRCRGTKEAEYPSATFSDKNNSSKGWNAINKHKATQLLKIWGVSTNMDLPGPDANLGNSVFILKASIFLFLFHSWWCSKNIKCLEKKWFSFIKLTLYHRTTPAFSAVTLPIEPLWTHQPVQVHDSFILKSQDAGALRMAEEVPHLGISEFWMLLPQQYVCPHQIHLFFLLLVPLGNFKDERQKLVDNAHIIYSSSVQYSS